MSLGESYRYLREKFNDFRGEMGKVSVKFLRLLKNIKIVKRKVERRCCSISRIF